MSGHESSRAAFEARWPKYSIKKEKGKYAHLLVQSSWEEWQAALDYAASRATQDAIVSDAVRTEEQARELREALERIARCEDAPAIDATGEWQTGLHCGVEDRDCRDRYDGADYGHSVGVEKALEWAVNEARTALAKKEAQP